MNPARVLRPVVRRLFSEATRTRMREYLSATPARRLYTQADDEVALITAELKSLNGGSWDLGATAASTAGMTERVIEIPWVISRIRGEHRLLDVGTTWALPVYLDAMRVSGVSELWGVDLVRKPVEGFRMVQGDVRSLPFRDASFELVVCISTLEHIGLDVSGYGGLAQSEASGDVLALRELARILTPGGRLLITVPFGRRQQLHWLRQYDQPAWDELVRQTDLQTGELAYYRYGDVRGWRRAFPPELPDRGFQELGAPNATGVLCAELTASA
ncbi:MAG TPA: class I SAM-dependent methyltransferase [Candidatus Dormibacteraeota bacterium]|nr:class I SAM-dependent methyltransferase [Candidatus Dormibacteraeota bacterium]